MRIILFLIVVFHTLILPANELSIRGAKPLIIEVDETGRTVRIEPDRFFDHLKMNRLPIIDSERGLTQGVLIIPSYPGVGVDVSKVDVISEFAKKIGLSPLIWFADINDFEKNRIEISKIGPVYVVVGEARLHILNTSLYFPAKYEGWLIMGTYGFISVAFDEGGKVYYRDIPIVEILNTESVLSVDRSINNPAGNCSGKFKVLKITK